MASATVYSSPGALPVSSTSASLSPSGSYAKPTSAPDSLTALHRASRLPGSGSATLGKSPSGVMELLIIEYSTPSMFIRAGPSRRPVPPTTSSTARIGRPSQRTSGSAATASTCLSTAPYE